MFRASCAHHQEVKIVLHSLWYHHTYKYVCCGFCMKHFPLSEEMREIWPEMYIGLHENTRYSSPISMKLEFSRQFFEKYTFVKFLENGPVGAELFHADRRTDDMTKLIIPFRNFAYALNNLNATNNNLAYSLYECHIHTLSRYGKYRLRLFELDTEENIWS